MAFLGVYQNAVAKCPAVEKSSPNFHQMALNDFLAMSSVPKKYFGFLVDEISERGHTIKWRKPNSKYSLYDFRLKASFKPIENI